MKEKIYNKYHGNLEKKLERELELASEAKHGNDKILADFYSRYYSVNDCEIATKKKVINQLRVVAEAYGKRLDDVNKKSFLDCLAKMMKDGFKVVRIDEKGKEFGVKKGKYKTIEHYAKAWKLLLRFLDSDLELKDRKYTLILESKLKTGEKKKRTTGVEKNLLLTDDEAIRFRNAAEKRGVHIATMLSVGMELGCRKENLGQALIRELTFNRYQPKSEEEEEIKRKGEILSYDIDTQGKTGSQHWHGVQTAKMLFDWVTNHHPKRGTKDFQDSLIFLTDRGRPWTGVNINSETHLLCRRAGIPKEKARPHWIFRHRRASYLFAKYPPQVVNKILNFSDGSTIGQKTYFHFTKNQQDRVLDEDSGLLSEAEETNEIDVLPVCPSCNTKADKPNAVVCKSCNVSIGEGTLKIVKEHHEDKSKIDVLENKLGKMEENLAKVLNHVLEISNKT